MGAVTRVEDAEDVGAGLESIGEEWNAGGNAGDGDRIAKKIAVEYELHGPGGTGGSGCYGGNHCDRGSYRHRSGGCDGDDGGAGNGGREDGEGRDVRDGGLVVGVAGVDGVDAVKQGRDCERVVGDAR